MSRQAVIGAILGGSLVGLVVWLIGAPPGPTSSPEPRGRAQSPQDLAPALPAASAATATAPVRLPRDPAMPVHFIARGVMLRADEPGAGRAWIAVNERPPQLYPLHAELHPDIFLREIAPQRVRIASRDGRLVWDLAVTPLDEAASPGAPSAATHGAQPSVGESPAHSVQDAGGMASQIDMQQKAATLGRSGSPLEGAAPEPEPRTEAARQPGDDVMRRQGR